MLLHGGMGRSYKYSIQSFLQCRKVRENNSNSGHKSCYVPRNLTSTQNVLSNKLSWAADILLFSYCKTKTFFAIFANCFNFKYDFNRHLQFFWNSFPENLKMPTRDGPQFGDADVPIVHANTYLGEKNYVRFEFYFRFRIFVQMKVFSWGFIKN